MLRIENAAAYLTEDEDSLTATRSEMEFAVVIVSVAPSGRETSTLIAMFANEADALDWTAQKRASGDY